MLDHEALREDADRLTMGEALREDVVVDVLLHARRLRENARRRFRAHRRFVDRTWSRSRWIVFLRRSAMCLAAAGACCGRTRLARENVSSGRGAIASARHSGGNCDSETLRPVPSMRSRSSQHSEEYTVPTYSCLRILSSFMLRSFLICPAGDHGWASVRASVKNGLRWRRVQAWYSSMVRQNRMLL